jgi:glycosyltransferase involved in cell wall biosynthesis
VPLSVLVASHNASAVIRGCLSALEQQLEPTSMEIIVADSSEDGTAEIVAGEFPRVRLIRCDAALGVPQLRTRAVAVARGEVIALLDPYSIPAPDWASAVLIAHRDRPNLVIGGLVDLHDAHRRSLAAWAVYFNEYGLFLPPAARGEATIVPGSNVSYKRAALFDGERPRHAEFWKTFVNEEAVRQHSPLWLEPSIVVGLNKPIAFGDFLRTRYLHGRCYAAMRSQDESAPMRFARAATAPAVAVVLQARWTRGIWPKRRERLRFLATLPLQFALFAMWAWGEFCGYLWGPGDACQRLYY